MTDPSNPDLVEQLAEKAQRMYCDTILEVRKISEVVIREAISVTRRETLEEMADFVEYWPSSDWNPVIKSELAAEIRRIGENDGKGIEHPVLPPSGYK